MSESRIEHFICPRCGYESPMEVWSSINVDLDPDLKERLLAGKLFEWKCEVCGVELRVPYGTLYHDMSHRFMLFFMPREDGYDKGCDRGLPGFQNPGSEGYTFRVVYGINALTEKIGILESGLDDVAVERMKHFMRMSPGFHLRDEEDLLFDSVRTDDERVNDPGFAHGGIVFVRLRKSGDIRAFSVPVENYYDHLQAVCHDPRFENVGFECVDRQWMKHKLSRQ